MGLFDAKDEIPGNLAAVQVLQELSKMLQDSGGLKILDVGCGPNLGFWKPLLNTKSYDFELYGVDIAGIEKAQMVIDQSGWDNVRLIESSGYNLSSCLEKNYFDVIVSTQVLEHIKHLKKFLAEIYKVLGTGGVAFLTLDSAHYKGKFRLKTFNPRHLLNRLLQLSSLGKEEYYDMPLYDIELDNLFENLGFKIVDRRFYNIHPLKEIHNHRILPSSKNEILKIWKELEDLLNMDVPFVSRHKRYFLDIYYKLQKA